MTVSKLCLLLASTLSSALLYAAPLTEPIMNQYMSLIEPAFYGAPTFDQAIYHQYAVTQTKKRWGEDTPLNKEQQDVEKQIEQLYSTMDKANQATLAKQSLQQYRTLIAQHADDTYVSKLIEFYDTELGKSVLKQLPSLALKKQQLVLELPLLISEQPALKSAINQVKVEVKP